MRDHELDVPGLAALMEGADHVDVRTVTGTLSLRAFVASTLSYQPAWMTFLYHVRGGVVRLLGMRQDGVPQSVRFSPDDVPLEPGAEFLFFTVHSAEDDRYWIGGFVDQHLTGHVVAAVEASGDGARRLHLMTIVHYNNWAGPVYFGLIRPFHHLIVRLATNAAVRG